MVFNIFIGECLLYIKRLLQSHTGTETIFEICQWFSDSLVLDYLLNLYVHEAISKDEIFQQMINNAENLTTDAPEYAYVFDIDMEDLFMPCIDILSTYIYNLINGYGLRGKLAVIHIPKVKDNRPLDTYVYLGYIPFEELGMNESFFFSMCKSTLPEHSRFIY